MTNQLTVRVDVENGIAVVSGSAAARNRALTAATAAGSQFLAVTAMAQPVQPLDGGEEMTPIVYPEGVIIVAAVAGFAGAVVGGVVTGMYSKKKKKD